MIKWMLLFFLFFYNISDVNKIDYNVNKLNYIKKLESYTKKKIIDESTCYNKNNNIELPSDSNLYSIKVNKIKKDIKSPCKKKLILKSIIINNDNKVSKSEILNFLLLSDIKIHSVFNKSSIFVIKEIIKKLYQSQNFYNIKVDINYTIVHDHDVILNIMINKGKIKYIKDIIITGNNRFNHYKLISLFYSYPNFLQKNIFLNKKYSDITFKNDLKQLRDFYYQHGYLDFDIHNVKIKSINNKHNFIIQIDIIEGLQYKISDLKLNTDNIDLKSSFKKIIDEYHDKIYDTNDLLSIKNQLKNLLFDQGFLKAKVHCKPIFNKLNHTVNLNFYTYPGDKFIIHKVYIQGNNFIKDSILYNVVKDLSPGSYAKLYKINQGKLNLERTDYVKNVDVEKKFLNTLTNEVDIIYNVEQKKYHIFGCGIGYDSSSGINVNLKFSHINWFKSGIYTDIDTFDSDYSKSIDFISNIPFLFHQSKLISDFYYGYNYHNVNSHMMIRNDEFKVSEKFNFPISINNNTEFTIGFVKNTFSQCNKKLFLLDNLKNIKDNFNDFIFDHNGIINTNIKLAWEYNNLENSLFPKSGKHLSMVEDIYLNKYCCNFFKVLFAYEQYYPLINNKNYILHDKFNVQFGSDFNRNYLDLYKDFYNHELNFIRGINEDKDYLYSISYHRYNPHRFNINISKLSNLLNSDIFFFNKFDLILPNIFHLKNYNKNYFRTSLFVDVGNVLDSDDNNVFKDTNSNFTQHNDFNDLRLTSGFECSCYSPLGILKLLFAYPLLYNYHDSIKYFQFFIDKT